MRPPPNNLENWFQPARISVITVRDPLTPFADPSDRPDHSTWPDTTTKLPASSPLELRHASTDRAIFVVVPYRRFLAIDGSGPAFATDFRLASDSLASVHGELVRLAARGPVIRTTRPYVRETLWWPPERVDDADLPARFADRAQWHWRQLVELPPGVDEAVIRSVLGSFAALGRSLPPIRTFSFTEGLAAQVLHVGDHATETDSVVRLLAEIEAAGYRRAGALHLLTLAEADRVPRGRGRQIVRQPVA
jgi:hypothetical protein